MSKDPDQRSAAETARLRDEGLRRMLKASPRPQAAAPVKPASDSAKTKD